jgi:cytochrome c oxidase subunit IV
MSQHVTTRQAPAPHGGPAAHDPGAPHAHVTPPPTYYAVYAALIALTLLTVGVSFFDLGAYNLAVGLGIGAIKATLVALFFMHLLHSTRLTWVVIGASLFWLGILMVLTLSDYLTRRWLSY